MPIGNDLNINQLGIQSFNNVNGVFTGVTIVGGTGITVTNGNGQAGNPTISLAGGGTAVEHLTGNTGGQLNPDGSNNFNILTANTTVKFAGASSTLTQDFALSNLLLGASGSAITSATFNEGFGFNALAALTSSSANVGIGYNSLLVLTSGSGGNTALGHNTLKDLVTGVGNTALGSSALTVLNSSSTNNTAVGANSLINLATGSTNIAVGLSSGINYTTSESSNIVIGNSGTVTESNVIRIGTQGSSTGQQNQCYLAGVLNTSSGRVVNVTTPGAYPYTTLITDFLILVDTSSARTITPLASPVTGTSYRIKDNVGSAASNNITITPSGKNIDGVASYVINTAYGSVDITYNGTQWNIL